MSKLVFITGASSGFGAACAEIFAKHGNRIIITGRRAERLQSLKADLESKYKADIFTLSFDVQQKQAVFQAIESLPAAWQDIDILINNAGLALGRDYFDEANLDDWETMIDTNLKGLLYVTKALLPYMKKQQGAHIINIGSTAGKEVYEKGNVYCATKSAVNAISQAMRIDLLQQGIRVTAVHPGAAETEFSVVRFKGDQEKADAVYKGYTPLSATDVAEVVYYCATLPSHICINDLVLTSTAQANSFYTHKSA